MYISKGTAKADKEQLKRLQEQLAKVTLERNRAQQELAVMRADRTAAGNEALEVAAIELMAVYETGEQDADFLHAGDVASWLRKRAGK